MSIINLIGGAILGVSAGLISAVLPNSNSDTAVSLVAAVGSFLGTEPEIAIECALGVSMLLGTVKEVQAPSLAASAVTIVPETAIEELQKVEPQHLTKAIISAKISAMGAGVVAGFALAPLLSVAKPLTSVAFVIGAYAVLKQKGCPTTKAVLTVLGFFALLSAAWWLAGALGISNPVIAISTCGFYLPSAFSKLKEKHVANKTGSAKPVFNNNLLSMAVSSVTALFSPAVNTHHVTGGSTANDIVSALALEVFFECFGLGMSLNGYTGSKFYSNIVLGAINPTNLLIAFGIALCSCLLLGLVSRWFLSIKEPKLLAFIISSCTLVGSCGWGVVIFLPLGLLISKLGVELKSFTYFSMLM